MFGQGWIGCDFDGTHAVAPSPYDPTTVGAPIPKMVERVKAWLAEGKDVRIFTARVAYVSPEMLVKIEAAIQKFCLDNLGKALPVTCIKDHEMLEFWDDRARQVELNTGVSVRSIPDSSLTSGTDRALEFVRVIKQYTEAFGDPDNWPVDSRENMFELLRTSLRDVVQKPFWSRLGIGYSNVSGQSFPESCALDAPHSLGPQGEPIYAEQGGVKRCVACECGGCIEHRYSEDQPRTPDGKFGSGSGTSTSQKDIAARPDFSGSMKVPGGTLTLSQNRTTKVAEVQAFAKSEMSKLPAGTQAALNSGMKTSDMYKTGDKYNADRVSSFHNPVVDKALAGKTPQGSPKVVFVGGGPAAGKTTASDDAARNMSDHVAINVDDIRTAAPEFTALLPDRLMPINEETGDIRDRLISEAGDARYNMIIDGVGSKSAAENVANLVGKGYTASYVYVHREVGDARQRAEDRPYMTSKIADMRILPQGMVEGFHDKARGAFSSMAKVSSEVKVIDKSRPEFGKEGKVVFWKDGSNIKVYDAEGVKRVENGGKTKIRIYP